jgi:hypothetical protein
MVHNDRYQEEADERRLAEARERNEYMLKQMSKTLQKDYPVKIADLPEPTPPKVEKVMTKIAGLIKEKIFCGPWDQARDDREKQSFLFRLITSFTRITPQKEDFSIDYDITPDGLTIHLKPESKYGKFAMQELFDQECSERLPK